MLEIYNTKTRKKERFKPLKQDKVKIYYCGPTVYNYSHIWNFRTYVFEDIVIKTLKFLWWKLETTMNLTDIDDKTIRDSILAWEDLKSFTQKYSDIFLDDLEKLWVEKADNIVPISTLIPDMIKMINWLLKRWYAYLWSDNSIYFDISNFKNYWKFANLDMKWLKKWARVDSDEYDKENASDFVLWKSYKESDWDNFWEEEFNIVKSEKWEVEAKDNNDLKTIKIKGRPGWHIECSTCNMKYFWAKIDIHMWWVDLIFPHHQNEIAQSEAYTWNEFSKYWMHSGHLTVDGKKMAKSANNFYTTKDLEERYSEIDKSILYRSIRLSFVNGKYRDSVDFTFDKLESQFNAIKRVDETIKRVLNYKLQSWLKGVGREFRDEMQKYIWDYVDCLENDINTPEALAVFFDFIKFVNSWISDWLFSLEESESILDMLRTFNEVLWLIDFDNIEKNDEVPEEVNELFNKRNESKKTKDFELADKLRDDILKSWYKIIDDRSGSRLEKI